MNLYFFNQSMHVSAAHCLYNETTRKLFQHEILKVAGGKYYRSFYAEEVHLQSSNVK